MREEMRANERMTEKKVTIAACVASFSWQFIGTLAVQPSEPNLILDQS